MNPSKYDYTTSVGILDSFYNSQDKLIARYEKKDDPNVVTCYAKRKLSPAAFKQQKGVLISLCRNRLRAIGITGDALTVC